MGVATGKHKKKNLISINQPHLLLCIHGQAGLQSFQDFLGASIFLNTASLISKARHKLIPGILRWGDIKAHLEVSVEASLQAHFSQLSLMA